MAATMVSVQSAEVEKACSSNGRPSYRWAAGWAVRLSDDGRRWYDAIQPYQSGPGAKARATKQAKELAAERGIPLVDEWAGNRA